jgi:hypothetical protein
MEYSPILAPVVALVAWTLLVMLWMLVARMGQFRRMGVTLGTIPNGSRGVDLDARPEASSAQWKSHNYNHLMEQPTIFYAIAITLALMGMGTGINTWLAWGYVGFRVLHSLVQCTVNVVRFRLTLFALASACLFGLTIHAAARILHDCGIIG